MSARRATMEDLDRAIDVLTAAFAHDPIWSWAFPDAAGLQAMWSLLVRSAHRFEGVWVTDGVAAVSVWIPPGETELTPSEEAEVEPIIDAHAGARAAEVTELLDRFEASRPDDPPNHYLSLLGIDPAHRGRGLGKQLLTENLAAIDAEGAPSFLESTNPANNALYERFGFRKVGEFARPDGGSVVTRMWREPQATREGT
jgi:ribosomal protein S18 acetylase RimI-like enzyme